MAVPQPRGIVALGELDDIAEFLDSPEVPQPQELLLQRSNESLGHSVPFRCTNEARTRIDTEALAGAVASAPMASAELSVALSPDADRVESSR